MEIREATIADIAEMHRIRMAVMENRLSDPAKVRLSDYEDLIRSQGKGWVSHVDGQIHGFGFINSFSNNFWALFVEPGYEKLGIGRRLHDRMLEWAFGSGQTNLWLTTAARTRAEGFYRRAGWRDTGRTPDGEIRFELSGKDWHSSWES